MQTKNKMPKQIVLKMKIRMLNLIRLLSPMITGCMTEEIQMEHLCLL